MTDLELAYLAGFFDGEGSIGVYDNGAGTYHLRTQLTQNKSVDAERELRRFLSAFGGNLSVQVTLSGKLKYNWQVNGAGAEVLLTAILPWLRLKRRQAEIACEWERSRPRAQRDARGRMMRIVDASGPLISAELKSLKRPRILVVKG